MLEYDAKPEKNWFKTQDRINCMEDALEDLEEVNISEIKAILSGRKGNLCNYDQKLKFDTLWSFCAELTMLDIERAEGNPSRAKFSKETRLDWAISKRK